MLLYHRAQGIALWNKLYGVSSGLHTDDADHDPICHVIL